MSKKTVQISFGFFPLLLFFLVTENADAQYNQSPSIRAIQFVSEKTGWMIEVPKDYFGNRQKIRNTNDSGKTWNTQRTVQKYEALKTLFAIDSTTCFAAGYGGIFRSGDGGKNWDSISHFSVNDLQFIDRQNGWAIGNNGKIYKTTDGGDSWATSIPILIENLVDVFFTDKNHGWILGEENTVLLTRNGGKIWKVIVIKNPEEQTRTFMCIGFTSSKDGFMRAKKGTLYRSDNGGKSWRYLGRKNIWPDRFGNFDQDSIDQVKNRTGEVIWERGKYRKLIKLRISHDLNISSFNTLNQTIHFAAMYKDLIKSTDGGKNWKCIYTMEE